MQSKEARMENLAGQLERGEVPAEFERVIRELLADHEEIDRLRVQLAGCGVAALGGTKDPAKKGDWGWSPAYQDTLGLRLKYEAAQQRNRTLAEAINKVWEVASGECQVAMDDTQGMEWISDYLSSIKDIAEEVAALASTAPVAEAGQPPCEYCGPVCYGDTAHSDRVANNFKLAPKPHGGSK